MRNSIVKSFSLVAALTLAFAAFSASCSLTDPAKINEQFNAAQAKIKEAEVKAKEQAKPAIEKFHQQFNESQFNEIYQQSDAKFKESATEAEATKHFENLRQKLGTVKSSTIQNSHVTVNLTQTIVALGCPTDFSKGAAYTEFTFLIIGEQVTLVSHGVTSPLLKVE